MINKNKYFDLQVNGYGGIDFNQPNLTKKDLHISCQKLKDDGVQGILATIITADTNEMSKCLQNIVKYREEDPLIKEIIYGIHIEGPFISSEDGYRGAHPIEFVTEANSEIMKSLLHSAGGLTKIVTLAPEVDKGNKLTRMMTDDGIIVSAGHCNPSLDEFNSAIDSGLSMFTHLANGCPRTMHRQENVIQRALSLKDKLWLCFIGDGMHIPFYVLKNYLDIAGYDKSIIVSDAMAAASSKPGKYQLGHLGLEVGEDGIVKEPGKDNFAGSSITMKQSSKNLRDNLGMDKGTVAKLTSLNPLKVLRIK